MFARRRISITVCFAALLALAGCGTGAGSEDSDTDAAGSTEQVEEQVELTFTNWISAEEPTIPAYEAMIAGFEEKHPGISVTTTSLPFNQIKDSLLVSASGGEPPDVAQIKEEWLPSLDAIGAVAQLDSVLPEETLQDYYPNLVTGATMDGALKAAPWAPSVVALYYNTALLQRAGFDGSPPTSWDEMIDMARAVAELDTTAQGNEVYGIGISDKKLEGAGYFLLPWLWNQGGDLLDENGEVVFDSEENVEAMSQIGELLSTGVAPVGVEIKDLRTLFAQGQLGFYFDIEAAVGIHDTASPKGEAFRQDYGVAAVPGEDGSPGRTFYTQHDLVVFEGSEHPEEAALLVDYLTGPEGLEIYNANGGFKLPARESSSRLDFYSSAEAEVLDPFLAALPDAVALPATNDQFTTAMETLADSIARVKNGEPAEEVVSSTAVALQQAYAG